jgi:5-methylcytosine-specific restriction protein B
VPELHEITAGQVEGMNAALAHLAPKFDSAASESLRLLLDGRNVVLYGPPGTGKTRAAFQVAERWQGLHGTGSVVRTTFHPSYSYEDFVEGWRPDPNEVGGFSLQDGVFLNAIDAAGQEGAPPVLCLMDEINRGDVARIFGELITYVEKDKRGIEFTTAQNRNRTYCVPDNIYLIGTMNTADKSINLLDVALRRRFAFIPCPPDPNVLATSTEWLSIVGGLHLADVLKLLNSRLREHDIEVDREIGHALLGIPENSLDPENDLLDRLYYDVLPLVEEYLYADRESVRQVLPGFLDDSGAPHRPISLASIAGGLVAGVPGPPIGEVALTDLPDDAGAELVNVDTEVMTEGIATIPPDDS